MKPLLKCLSSLEIACQGGDQQVVETELKSAEELISRGLSQTLQQTDISSRKEVRQELKSRLTIFWSKIGKTNGTITLKQKARLREVSTLILQFVTKETGGGLPSVKLETELARAWLKTSRDWLNARQFHQSISAAEKSIEICISERHNDSTKALTITAEAHLVIVDSSWKDPTKGTEAAIQHIKEVLPIKDLWSRFDERCRLIELLHDIAESQSRQKESGLAYQTLTLTKELIDNSGVIPSSLKSKIKRLESHILLCSGQVQKALTAAKQSYELQSSCVSLFQYCKVQCYCLPEEVGDEPLTDLVKKLRNHDDYNSQIAISLSSSLVKVGNSSLACSLLSQKSKNDFSVSCKLFSLLVDTGDVDQAYKVVSQIVSDFFNDVSNSSGTLPTEKVTFLYATIFSKAEQLADVSQKIKWMTQALRIVPPSKSLDICKISRSLSQLHLKNDECTSALKFAKMAEERDPNSVLTIDTLVKTYLALDDLTNTEECIQKLKDIQDSRKPLIAASCAHAAYQKQYFTLAAHALAVLAACPFDGSDVLTASDRIQLLVNLIICYEKDAPQASVVRGHVTSVLKSALEIFKSNPSLVSNTSTSVIPTVSWWKHKADSHSLFSLSSSFSKLLGDRKNELFSLLRHVSVELDQGGVLSGDVEDVISEIEKLIIIVKNANGGGGGGGGGDELQNERIRVIYQLLKIKLEIKRRGPSTSRLLIELSELDGVVAQDFESVSAMAGPGTANYNPVVASEISSLALRRAWPNTEDDLVTFAPLLRRSFSEAPGRDQQWELALKSKEAILHWKSSYPVVEIEWLAAELWNNGIYFFRLENFQKSEAWMSLSHNLAQLLPVCETRSEIDTQFDIALAQQA